MMKALQDFTWSVEGAIKAFKTGDEVKLSRPDLADALQRGLIEGELPAIKVDQPKAGDEKPAESKAATKPKAEK
jgi:hypothetical protein